MLDDFSALDFLSMGGFQFLPPPQRKPGKGMKKRLAKTLAKRIAQGWHHHHDAAQRPEGERLLPMLGRKLHIPHNGPADLQGWPVPLSWPTKDVTEVELWQPDQGEPPVA